MNMFDCCLEKTFPKLYRRTEHQSSSTPPNSSVDEESNGQINSDKTDEEIPSLTEDYVFRIVFFTDRKS